jgi:DNA repair exonuclease SbcCD nuclease subunit
MKVCILGDTHFGMRNDSVVFMDYAEKFYDEIFFPYLIEHKITRIIQLGDFFDRRKYINFLTYHRTLEMFIDKLHKYGITMFMIPGNHDVFYKNTNRINSLKLLVEGKSNVSLFEEPIELFDKICLIPWMTEDNEQECMEFINKTNMPVCMGHFDIIGFSMHKGWPSFDGLDSDVFKKFELVLSGHYHHRSKQANIMYVGTPMQITWQDYDDPRGFHIFDLDDLSMEFIQNPYEMFHHIPYDDKTHTMAEINGMDLSKYTNTQVKVVIVSKTNPHLFDKFMTNLYDVNPSDVTVVEDFTELNDDTIAEDALDQAEDTLTIINKYIDASESDSIDPAKLKSMVKELYNEALNREDV